MAETMIAAVCPGLVAVPHRVSTPARLSIRRMILLVEGQRVVEGLKLEQLSRTAQARNFAVNAHFRAKSRVAVMRGNSR